MLKESELSLGDPVSVGERGLVCPETIEELFRNKKDRKVSPSKETLYVHLVRPDFSIDELIYGVLSSCLKDPDYALRWAKHFGRVVVVAGTRLPEVQCQFIDKDSPNTLSLLPVMTNRLIEPQELIGCTQGQFALVVNSKPTAIEGLTVALVHLVDELVWARYRALPKNSPVENSALYSLAVQEVLNGGIKVEVRGENEIISLFHRFGDQVSIRFYGSRKIDSLPQILGAVYKDPGAEPKPISSVLGKQRVDIEEGSLAKPRPERTRSKGDFKPFRVGAAVAAGKRLHIGHAFHFTTVDMIRRAVGSGEITLFANDRGPRIAGMIVALSRERRVGVKEACQLLAEGIISPEEIQECYRNRVCEGHDFVEAMEQQFTTGGLLRSMVERMRRDLDNIGLRDLRLVEESALRNKGFVDGLNPLWKDSGFSYVKVGNNRVVNLELDGFPTSTAAALGFMFALAGLEREKEELENIPIFVDNGAMVSDASLVLKEKLNLESFQVAGAAVALNLRVISGSESREAFCLPLILQETFPEESLDSARNLFMRGITFMLLEMGCTAVGEKVTNINANSFYNFKDLPSLVSAIQRFSKKGERFLSKVTMVENRLRSMVGNEELRTSGNNQIDSLCKEAERVVNLKPEKAVRMMAKPTEIRLPNKYREYEQYLASRAKGVMEREKIRGLLIALAIEKGGQILAREAYNIVKQHAGFATAFLGDARRPDTLLPIPFVPTVLAGGYDGKEAEEMVIRYMNGELTMGVRRNPYYEFLRRVVSELPDTQCVGRKEASLVLEAMRFCSQHLGFMN